MISEMLKIVAHSRHTETPFHMMADITTRHQYDTTTCAQKELTSPTQRSARVSP
jgi:hypothetical protein